MRLPSHEDPEGSDSETESGVRGGPGRGLPGSLSPFGTVASSVGGRRAGRTPAWLPVSRTLKNGYNGRVYAMFYHNKKKSVWENY